ncbi:hypothetical protein [Streptomyces erythrochromogenes]|nr:hypothetical protein OG489_00140 [Streptomyces erythrochromogenes]WSR88338.1 hypothetical protein OG489_39820 [Streptomyces erythrochromogenes]
MNTIPRTHDDGTPIHRYTCTIHDGERCDGHCGHAPDRDEDVAER